MSALQIMTERRAAKKAELDALLALPTEEKRDLTEEEDASFSTLVAEIRSQDERIAELADEEQRAKAAAETRRITGDSGVPVGGAKVVDPPVYDLHNLSGPSYFRDLYKAQHQADREAQDRLRRSSQAESEKRALGNTGAAGGSGGEFAPPEWLVNEFVALARPGRVAANLFTHNELPAGVSSINIPKVATGTTVAIQSTQNTTLSQTDLTTTSISSGIATIGGKQVVSMQLLEQSAIPFDRVILGDLALAYAVQLNTQALSGAGTSGTLRGLGSAAGLVTQTYTNAAPAVVGAGQFYAQLVKASSTVYANRFMPPDTILMTPTRWAWVAAAFDTQNRPLLPLTGTSVNPLGDTPGQVAQGYAGNIAGLEVYVDPTLPQNLGTGTNQDLVYVFRRGDIQLYETAPKAETFTEPYADSLGVLYRLYAYAAQIPDRYGSSIVQIGGTGLTAPTF